MRVIKKSNYRIVVEPVTHIFGIELSEDTQKRDLKNMEEQIKRHVDNIGDISIRCDINAVCSHCGRDWEVSEDDTDIDFPKGTPFCCQPAIDEYNSSNQLNPQK